MQIITLLPLLALLAAPLDAREHGAAGRRNVARHAQHVRAAEHLAANVARKEQLAQTNPKAIRRVKKRGANGCRVRGTTYSASTNATTSATASASSVVVSTSASVVSTPASSAATSASAVGGQNWAAPSASDAQSSAAPQSSAAAPAQSSAPVSNNVAGVTPNGIKAGTSGSDILPFLGNHVSWTWNYQATPWGSTDGKIYVPTLWGNGNTGSQDSGRVAAFEALTGSYPYVQGFYEPDCSPPMSSAIDPWTAAPLWNSAIAPWKAKGALLVSPGMCKQADEDWLTPFKNAIGGDNMWDITSVHINKVDMDGVRKVLDHYWNTYGKPMWVTEFACVNDVNGFTPCTDQGQINNYINNIVDLLENDSRVAAYSMSEGEGLGNVWPPMSNGQLTESGQTYLNAISKYH